MKTETLRFLCITCSGIRSVDGRVSLEVLTIYITSVGEELVNLLSSWDLPVVRFLISMSPLMSWKGSPFRTSRVFSLLCLVLRQGIKPGSPRTWYVDQAETHRDTPFFASQVLGLEKYANMSDNFLNLQGTSFQNGMFKFNINCIYLLYLRGKKERWKRERRQEKEKKAIE